jgi:hypothetical protein
MIPAAAGLAAGYGVHRYQASQIREDATPYRIPDDAPSPRDFRNRAFSFIEKPTDVIFGEIENYKRYQTDWNIVNTGRKTLELELVSKTCEVTFNGAPIEPKHTIPGSTMVPLVMSWVAEQPDGPFDHELVLKTNDDVEERRNLRFHVKGTVIPTLEVQPLSLDFGSLAGDQDKTLVAHVFCYRTKSFTLEEWKVVPESLGSAFVVVQRNVDGVKPLGTSRVPSSVVEIAVTAKASVLGSTQSEAALELRCNLPGIEGLRIRLRANGP